jgi:hypothetical protein
MKANETERASQAQAQARRELKYCLSLAKRAQAGDWRAAATWLETFRPDEWALPKRRRLKS